MAKNKRSDLNVEDVVGLISKSWKRAETIEEIKKRAEKGYRRFNSKNCSLNDIWNIYKTYPESFLFSEYVAEMQKNYIDFHTYKFGNHDVQEFNMQSAISKIVSATKSIYGEVEKEIQEQKKLEKEKKKLSRIAERQEELPLRNAINLFDEEENVVNKNSWETKKMIKQGDYKILHKPLKIMFQSDTTPIENFCPINGENIVRYLKGRNVETLGELMKLMLDERRFHNFQQFGNTCKDQYRQFNAKVLQYVNEKAAEKTELLRSDKITKESLESNSKDDNVKFFDKLLNMPTENFVKDSEKMAKISSMVGDYLKELTDIYLSEGFSPEEVDKAIDDELTTFRCIVDKKRQENDKKLAAARIKVKIDEGVKYKHDQKPRKEGHSHNPFVDGKEF